MLKYQLQIQKVYIPVLKKSYLIKLFNVATIFTMQQIDKVLKNINYNTKIVYQYLQEELLF